MRLAVILLLARLLGVAAHDLDLLGLDGLVVVQLEVDVLDQERPHIVTEAVRVEVALQGGKPNISDRALVTARRGVRGFWRRFLRSLTLKFSRALTRSWSISVMERSKRATTFMASCGSMRPSLTISSRVSTSVRPILRGESLDQPSLREYAAGLERR